jgi:hypothetical protein
LIISPRRRQQLTLASRTTFCTVRDAISIVVGAVIGHVAVSHVASGVDEIFWNKYISIINPYDSSFVTVS